MDGNLAIIACFFFICITILTVSSTAKVHREIDFIQNQEISKVNKLIPFLWPILEHKQDILSAISKANSSSGCINDLKFVLGALESNQLWAYQCKYQYHYFMIIEF